MKTKYILVDVYRPTIHSEITGEVVGKFDSKEGAKNALSLIEKTKPNHYPYIYEEEIDE